MTSPEAIGQILSCPKCGSFVMVEAPPGFDLTASSGDESGSGSQGSGVGGQSSGVKNSATSGSGVGNQASGLKNQESAVKQQSTGVQKPESAPSQRDVGLAKEAKNTPTSSATVAATEAKIPAIDKLSPWKDPPAEDAPDEVRISESVAAVASSITPLSHPAGVPACACHRRRPFMASLVLARHCCGNRGGRSGLHAAAIVKRWRRSTGT